ncbi:MAG: peptidyl-prolyl cis-trans isomerase [Pirellulales bacterium]|nr:peptidyl-prolyl cis-trans isomerase [Pirellulales bacterium]
MSPVETVRKEKDSRSFRLRFIRWAWKHQVGWMVAAAVVLTAVFQFRQVEGDRSAKAQAARTNHSAETDAAQLPRVEKPQHDIMAMVNGQDISREALGRACLQRYGEQVLESLVNKRLIMNHCNKRNITISQEELAAEVDRMAKRFQLGREQWLKMLEQERGITAQEYARDIVWPTLALRKLAATDIEVTEKEIQKAYEQEFGEMVRARLIAVENAELAEQLHAQLSATPNSFARVAIEHSIDVNSASVGGLIQPIRRHVGDPGIEKAAFRLQVGEISPVIKVANQFVILKCEGRIPARQLNPDEVQRQLVEKIKDEKLRQVAHKLFEKLQSTATVQNVYNQPKLRETMPGVVATVNGDRITMKELREECLLRHGEEILETEISHLLLRQALQQAQLNVTDSDLEAEVRHAVELAGVVDQQGQPDLETWYQTVTTQQGISKAQYVQNAVWPSAALKKLTAQQVQVTEEDMQKGFEANYGQRVRCRAIVLGTMRRAQEVWDKARRNPSLEYFGDLAEEYSIEPTTKSLRGEVPPLQRFGGQPQLEEAAFQLEPGQLSGIVQVGDKFIVLRCEGRTERMDIDMAEVQDILKRDIYEKKLRLAMNEKFEEIRARSRVDNYLAGTSHAPNEPGGLRHDAAVKPTAAQR